MYMNIYIYIYIYIYRERERERIIIINTSRIHLTFSCHPNGHLFWLTGSSVHSELMNLSFWWLAKTIYICVCVCVCVCVYLRAYVRERVRVIEETNRFKTFFFKKLKTAQYRSTRSRNTCLSPNLWVKYFTIYYTWNHLTVWKQMIEVKLNNRYCQAVLETI